MFSVYTITQPETGVYYIGMSGEFDKRRGSHLGQLKKGIHKNKTLQAAYNANNNLEWDRFELDTREDALYLEKEMVQYHKDDPKLANLCLADKGHILFSDERRQQIADRVRGTKHTEETKRYLAEINKDTAPTAEALALAAETNRKEIVVDEIVYRTASEAAIALNVHVSTVLNRARNPRPQWNNWQIVDRGDS